MGFSAGGHLASMLGLSKNNGIESFFMPGTNHVTFSIKAVVDFYGPAELLLFPGNNDSKSPESLPHRCSSACSSRPVKSRQPRYLCR